MQSIKKVVQDKTRLGGKGDLLRIVQEKKQVNHKIGKCSLTISKLVQEKQRLGGKLIYRQLSNR